MSPAACPAGDIGSPVTGRRLASPKSGRIQLKVPPGLELSLRMEEPDPQQDPRQFVPECSTLGRS